MAEIPYGYCYCGCGNKTIIAKQSITKVGLVRGQPRRYVHGHNVKVNKTIQDRFWAKVSTRLECWEWQGAKNRFGYGCLHYENEELAHRVSWLIHNGLIPKGLCVLHKCDNPCCVRPDHLFLGTQKDNMEDMVLKGRGKTPNLKGEDCNFSKLSATQVLEIRGLDGKKTQSDIAALYGVKQANVSAILLRKNWKHI
jgi:hypothetical protein